MSYTSINQCAIDPAFMARVTAAAAAEGATKQPDTVMYEIRWAVAVASDVAAAYESAVAAGNPNPGGDPAVITDGMILSSVQANWPDPAP
jgi:hypothetical protein